MKLKILFFPIILIGAVVFTIWHVWPMYQENTVLHGELEKYEKQLGILEERKNLVDALSVELQQNQSARDFLFKYIPKEPDEEHVISSIIHAVEVSGVNLTSIDISRTGDAKSQFFSSKSLNLSSEEGFAEMPLEMNITGSNSNGAMLRIKKPSLKEYMADVIVIGPYENVRKFLDAIHKINRLHGTVSVELGQYSAEDSNSASEEEKKADTNRDLVLAQTLMAFAYSEDVVVPRGAEGAIFERDIDISFMQNIQTKYTISPPFGNTNAGRQNPFINE